MNRLKSISEMISRLRREVIMAHDQKYDEPIKSSYALFKVPEALEYIQRELDDHLDYIKRCNERRNAARREKEEGGE